MRRVFLKLCLTALPVGAQLTKEVDPMETRWSFELLSLAACTVLVAAVPASVQTVDNGPYYELPSGDQPLPVSTRFVVLANMNGEAVLDRETGLVWQRTVVADDPAGVCLRRSAGDGAGGCPPLQSCSPCSIQRSRLRPTSGLGTRSASRLTGLCGRRPRRH